MSNNNIPASTAFKQGVDQSKRQHKKYADSLGKNHTHAHLLLNETDAESLRQTRFDFFTKKVMQAVDRRNLGKSALSKQDRKVIQAITGKGGASRGNRKFSCLASNPHGRKVFFDEVYRQLKTIHADPDIIMHFATIVDVDWCLKGDAGSFDTTSMMLRAKRALRDICYHGLLILEVQLVTNLPEARFMAHLHGFIWRRGDDGIGPRKAAQKLNGRFAGIRKATGVTIAKLPQNLPDSLTTRLYYSTKLPDTTNGYCPMKGDNNSFVTETQGVMKKNVASNYTDLDALRIAGILAQHQVDQTVFAVGEGTKVRKAASKVLSAEVVSLKRQRPDPSPREVLAVIAKLLRE